jgi:hypothetical protein
MILSKTLIIGCTPGSNCDEMPSDHGALGFLLVVILPLLLVVAAGVLLWLRRRARVSALSTPSTGNQASSVTDGTVQE